MCLLAHVVSQCTRLPRTSIRSGRLLDRPGVAGRYSDTLGIAGQLLDALGILGRNSDTPGVLGRNIAITQRWSGRLLPENAASVRMSPENESESPEHGSHRSSPENENETPEPGIHEPNALKTSNVSNGANHHRSRMNTIRQYTIPSKHVKWGISEWNTSWEPYRGPSL